MAELCTKISAPPPSGVMKPYPLPGSYQETVPSTPTGASAAWSPVTRTRRACGPRSPSPTSNSTSCPSRSSLGPSSPTISDACTNRSSAPSPRARKPNPRSASNQRTVPWARLTPCRGSGLLPPSVPDAGSGTGTYLTAASRHPPSRGRTRRFPCRQGAVMERIIEMDEGVRLADLADELTRSGVVVRQRLGTRLLVAEVPPTVERVPRGLRLLTVGRGDAPRDRHDRSGDRLALAGPAAPHLPRASATQAEPAAHAARTGTPRRAAPDRTPPTATSPPVRPRLTLTPEAAAGTATQLGAVTATGRAAPAETATVTARTFRPRRPRRRPSPSGSSTRWPSGSSSCTRPRTALRDGPRRDRRRDRGGPGRHGVAGRAAAVGEHHLELRRSAS